MSPTSSVCEGSRDAKLDVRGAGAQVILSAKSETFWCPMSTAASPCWATDRAWESRNERLSEVAVLHLVNDVVGRLRAVIKSG